MLHLVRHGRARAGIEDRDPGLDTVGREQARRAAEALRDSDATRLVVSPLRRTRETAEPIAQTLGLEPQIHDAVAEVFDPTMPTDERRSMIGPLLAGRWSEQPDELRSWRDRVLQALAAFGSEDTIVVSHFVAISVAIGAAMDDDRVSPVPLPNAAITTLDVRAGRPVLVKGPSVAHLPEDLVTAAHTGLAGRATR